MKINQDLRINPEKVKQDSNKHIQNGIRFNELVEKQGQKLHATQLQSLLTDIENAGERLAKSRTFKDLTKYKNLVKKFIGEAVDFGMNLKQSHSWTQYGQGRALKIVETIDEKLVELTEEIIEKEKNGINILGKIGEIKGLLVNLYT